MPWWKNGGRRPGCFSHVMRALTFFDVIIFCVNVKMSQAVTFTIKIYSSKVKEHKLITALRIVVTSP